MKKLYVYSLIVLILLTGCNKIDANPSDLVGDDTNNNITSEQEEKKNTEQNHDEEPPTLGDETRQVDSTDNLITYENLKYLKDDERDKISNFDMEQCYFRLINEPENMDINYIAFWEIGFFVNYVNTKTNESLEFKWWTWINTEEYLKGIKETVENSVYDSKIITRNEIDYYCVFVVLEGEPSDTIKKELIYQCEIQWIEDGKCFCIRGKSNTPYDDSILDYCQIKKYILE